MAVKKKKPQHYVNNKELLGALIEFRKSVKEAEDSGDERPPVTSYIGECIMKIATRLSNKANFNKYTFKEEMISDGIENCIRYIDNFDPAKSENPFAYFTTIIHFAFLRRIEKEKKHLYTKYKVSERQNIMNEEDIPASPTKKWDTQYINNFIEDFEANKRRKQNKRKVAVDKIMKE